MNASQVLATLAPHPQIGGQDVKADAVAAPYHERVADPGGTAGRLEHRLATVQTTPAQRIVAEAEREIHLLGVAVGVFDEVDQQVAVPLGRGLVSVIASPVSRASRQVVLDDARRSTTH